MARLLWFINALIAGLLLYACTAPTSSAELATDTPAVRQFQEMVNDLSDPKMEGRGAGTRGIELARDYLVERFAALNLEPAFGDKYTQPFELTTGTEAKTQTLEINGKSAAGVRISALGFSANGVFEGEAVFVGYGIVNEKQNYDSYAHGGDLVRGRVAVVMRYEPMDDDGNSRWTKEPDTWSRAASLTSKARWAAEHGAIAVLFVNAPTHPAPLRTTRETSGFQAATLPVMHVDTEVFDGDVDWRAWQQAADRGEMKPVRIHDGKVKITGEVELVRTVHTVENVAALAPGAGDRKDEVVVIGAHYDHLGYGGFGSLSSSGKPAIHHGADDNASGVAALLMVAERFAQRTASSRRAVLFIAFAGEERGLLGSNWFLKHIEDTAVPKSKLVAMINMDMVGRMQNDKVFVLGTGSGDGWKQMAKEAADHAGLNLVTDAAPLGSSDHATFFMHKVPAVHIFSGAHEDYHRPSDTAEKINARGGAAVVDCVEHLAVALAAQPERIAYNSRGARQAHAGRSMSGGAFLGIMPDYATMSGDQGCGISGLTPGGPALAAGLKVDDLIVAWNGTKIGNVYDLTRTLGEAEPDEKVTLKIKRDQETLDVSLTLGKR